MNYLQTELKKELHPHYDPSDSKVRCLIDKGAVFDTKTLQYALKQAIHKSGYILSDDLVKTWLDMGAKLTDELIDYAAERAFYLANYNLNDNVQEWLDKGGQLPEHLVRFGKRFEVIES